MRAIRVACLCASALLSGCYYGHIGLGHLEVLRGQQSISELLADPGIDSGLRGKLQTVIQARAFASRVLGLPDNRSYTHYRDLGRPYVVWNVFAAPEFSTEAKHWCHLLVGCLAYRGYFDPERAEHEAARLRKQGLDVHVGGVSAYSTLGWFSDPVLNTMLAWSGPRLAGLIFHELSHQQLFVEGDTEFNESYASFVEQRGLQQWLQQQGRSDDDQRVQAAREAEFLTLVLSARDRLTELYASGLTPEIMRQGKAAAFDALRQDYARLRDERWGGYSGYDAWFDGPLNNARLLPLAIYGRWTPAFDALFAQEGEDWAGFHAAAQRLGSLQAEAREAALTGLLPADATGSGE